MVDLFDPIQLGDLFLSSRIIMSPLTRCRASEGRVPNELMLKYYRQRASAGLIISEATAVDPMGVGYPDTPGVWSRAQVEGWKKITRAVHDAGGKMILQLWHVGRISHPLYLDGKLPVAPSAIQPKGHVSQVRPFTDYVQPRALELNELPQIIAAYRNGAENAKAAGFDGVEVHGANGYLLDQFLQSKTNQRVDAYGGSIENRARLMLEVTDAVIEVWGARKVGMHLAPRGDSNDMGDDTPLETFTYVARELGKRGIAFIMTREKLGADSLMPAIKAVFGGAVIANEGFDYETASKLINENRADAVGFGKLMLANPDLVQRFKQHAPLNAWDAATFYAPGEKGYTDYPSLHESDASPK